MPDSEKALYFPDYGRYAAHPARFRTVAQGQWMSVQECDCVVMRKLLHIGRASKSGG